MSHVPKVGSNASILAQQLLLQRVNDQDAEKGAAQRKAGFVAALTAAGADSAKLPELEKKIQDAVQAARKNANGTTDAPTAVRSAIHDVLKKNGLDPAKFDAKLKAQRVGRRHHGGGSAASSSGVDGLPTALTPLAQTKSELADSAALNVVV